MRLISAVRKWLSVNTLALVFAVGLAGYGAASLLAPDGLDLVGDVLGLTKVPVGDGIEDGSV
jgi:hypothetical protein